MSNESVYQLIEEQRAAAQKPAMYRSKHNHFVPPSYSTFGTQGTSKVFGNVAGDSAEDHSVHPSKKPVGIFGRTVVDTVDPHNFLKRTNGATAPASAPTSVKRHHDDEKKVDVPKRDERPVMGLKTDKNFVVANAVENILAVPKKQPIKETRHVEKATYGKVPTYIQRTKAELEKQYALVDKYGPAARKEQDRFEALSAAELNEIRNGLQKRWDALNKEFQTMGFNLETRSQKKHQEAVESELRVLEAALQKVNKPHIFVYNDDA